MKKLCNDTQIDIQNKWHTNRVVLLVVFMKTSHICMSNCYKRICLYIMKPFTWLSEFTGGDLWLFNKTYFLVMFV